MRLKPAHCQEVLSEAGLGLGFVLYLFPSDCALQGLPPVAGIAWNLQGPLVSVSLLLGSWNCVVSSKRFCNISFVSGEIYHFISQD